jgi:hypothetical protein
VGRCDEACHGTGAGGRHTVNERTADVKVCASAAVGVDTTAVAEQRTGVYIVLVNEGEAHVLQTSLALKKGT